MRTVQAKKDELDDRFWQFYTHSRTAFMPHRPASPEAFVAGQTKPCSTDGPVPQLPAPVPAVAGYMPNRRRALSKRFPIFEDIIDTGT